MQIPKIKSPSCIGGENPMWDVISERLYYIDNVGRKVQSLDPAAGATTTLEMPGVPTIERGSHGEPIDAGSLYVIDGVGARGLPEYRYTG